VLRLAREEVSQARDRFRAGVANNIEVISAQDSLARANDNQILALYRFNQARRRLCARGLADGKRPTRSEDAMSVEIEVGFGECGKTSKCRLREPRKTDLTPQGLLSPKVRRFLIIGGVVLLAALLALFLYFHNRESTDDAQVDGHITPIAAKISGRIGKVLVEDNQAVKAGQVLAQIEPADYQAAVDQAKGALALAEGEARSAGVDVPRTKRECRQWPIQRGCALAGAQADLLRAQASTSRRKPRTSPLHRQTWTAAAPTRNSPSPIWSATPL